MFHFDVYLERWGPEVGAITCTSELWARGADPKGVLEEQADQPRRDRRHDKQRGEAMVGRLDAAGPQGPDQSAHDPRPGPNGRRP